MAAATPGPAANEASIYGFLKAHGLTSAQSAGILGNLQAESGFDPTQPNDAEGAIGIAQWEGGRRTALDSYAAAHHGSETDLSIQLGYLWSELSGPYASVLARIKGTNDAGTVARYWDVGPGGANSGTGFENSSGSTTGTRVGYAQSIYQSIVAGTLKPGAVGGINGGTGATIAGTGDSATGAAGDDSSSSSWTDLLPWNWAKDAKKEVGGIVNAVLAFLLKMGFVGAGLVLVILGAWRASSPAREKAQQASTEVAGAAAKVA